MTFNLETGQKLTLSDVFKPDSSYLNLISELAAKELRESGRLGDSYDEAVFLSGTSAQEQNFANFGLKRTQSFLFPAFSGSACRGRRTIRPNTLPAAQRRFERRDF
jgi:hypothetical protein